jgi:pimeloyl-ACP methyl ester carboxylesterase
VVTARTGWPFPQPVVAARLAAVRDLQHIEVEGGHHVHLTHPELIAPVVRGFLQDTQG